jgi:beta-ribofuranosylaminobenzene 5'-phosphate synthase
MIRVSAASRLHFGLLSLPTEPLSARRFGGVGLMVQKPGLALSVRRASAWSAEGPLAERALAFAGRCCEAALVERAGPPAPHHIAVERAPPEHAGLGTGTQLGVAVAQALAESWGLSGRSTAELARWVGRGARSALGVHGFARGGFLVEAGKTPRQVLAPLVARCAFPGAWRVVLVLPRMGQGLHGIEEGQAFKHLAGRPPAPAATDRLCRLALLGMLPALMENDLPAFGEALFEFNRLVGEAFRPVQGGPYAHPRLEEMVTFVHRQGVHGVGQSSWGPALFAVAGDVAQAEDLARDLRQRFHLEAGEVLVSAAANEGASVTGTNASPP